MKYIYLCKKEMSWVHFKQALAPSAILRIDDRLRTFADEKLILNITEEKSLNWLKLKQKDGNFN